MSSRIHFDKLFEKSGAEVTTRAPEPQAPKPEAAPSQPLPDNELPSHATTTYVPDEKSTLPEQLFSGDRRMGNPLLTRNSQPQSIVTQAELPAEEIITPEGVDRLAADVSDLMGISAEDFLNFLVVSEDSGRVDEINLSDVSDSEKEIAFDKMLINLLRQRQGDE